MSNLAEMLLLLIVLIPLAGLMTLPAMLMKQVPAKQTVPMRK